MLLARRIVVPLLAVVTAAALAASLLVAAWLAGVRVPIASGTTYVEIEKLGAARSFGDQPASPVFVLLVGSDYRPGVGGERGDAIHVVGVNAQAGEATIVNVPRDLCVPVPGYGTTKINAAHSQGGPALQAQVVGDLLGVDIAYAVSVDFAGFTGIVSGMGGVQIDVQEPHSDRYSGAYLDAGPQRLNADQALAYSRNRHDWASGDLQRTQNQGHLILAGIRQLQDEASSARGRLKVAMLLGRHARLEGMGLSDVIHLGELAYGVDPAKVRNVPVPTVGGGCSGGLSASDTTGLFADFADDAVLQDH